MPLQLIGWVLWAGVASAFGVILFYRALISAKREDVQFVPEAEQRRNARHRRDVERCALAFGVLTAAGLVVLLAWAR